MSLDFILSYLSNFNYINERNSNLEVFNRILAKLIAAQLICFKIDMYISVSIKHLIKDDSTRQFANEGFIQIYVSVNQEASVHRVSKQLRHNLCQLCFREAIINLLHCPVSSKCTQGSRLGSLSFQSARNLHHLRDRSQFN